jgi:hypothetical protein
LKWFLRELWVSSGDRNYALLTTLHRFVEVKIA